MVTLHSSALLLVGHGGVPTDLPHQRVAEFKQLERTQVRRPTPEGAHALEALDREIRHWPRTPETDPYQAGFEALGRRLQRRFPERKLMLAYNEFCIPSVPDAIEQLVGTAVTNICVLSTMFTPGGAHSELEIPALLAEARARHPGVTIHYAWPFDLDELADFLAAHVESEDTETTAHPARLATGSHRRTS